MGKVSASCLTPLISNQPDCHWLNLLISAAYHYWQPELRHTRNSRLFTGNITGNSGEVQPALP